MTIHAGGCFCGAVRFETSGPPLNVTLCHCRDCRRAAGAPVVAWAMFPEDALRLVAGAPRVFNSSGTAFRSSCPVCGTGLFYRNDAMLPGVVDIQAAVFDDPEALPPGIQIQTAEMLGWMRDAHDLPMVERYPSA